MERKGNKSVAVAVLVAIVVACLAVLGNAQCALRLTPGVSEGGSGGKASCTAPSSEGASEVAKLTESEGISVPAFKLAAEAEVDEGKFEITSAGEYSLKYGSYDGSPVIRGQIFFCP